MLTNQRIEIDWTRQTVLSRPDLLDPRPLNKDEAKERLSAYLGQRQLRISTLKAVLLDNGVAFSATEAGMIAATEFFISAARVSNEGDGFSGPFIEFLWNFGQSIGDYVISKGSKGVLKWITEDRAVRFTTPNFVFSIKGYAGASETFNPDRLLLDIARAVQSGEDIPGSIIVMHCERVCNLAKGYSKAKN